MKQWWSQKMLTLTVQFSLLVVQKMCHQLCVLLCSRANPRSLSLSSEGIQRWYAPMPSARQYDWKCRICVKTPNWLVRQRSKARTIPKLSQRKLPDATSKLCSSKPSRASNHGACFKHGNVLIKTPRPLSNVFPLTEPHEWPWAFFKTCLLLPNFRFFVLIQAVANVASGRRTSLPTRRRYQC